MIKKNFPLLVSIEKIWDHAPHSAFTDLIKWNSDWYCIFREADSHYGDRNGILCLLHSSNGLIWKVKASFELEGWDLRDPKLSLTPDGKLMLLAGASKYNRAKQRLAHQSIVSFSSDGETWSDFIAVLHEEWLWRLTWFQGIGYGVSYFYTDPMDRKSPWRIRLCRTQDGIHYDSLTIFHLSGKPNETTIRFQPDGQMILLVRRNGQADNYAWIGISAPPYEDWLWNPTNWHLGGPNFLILPHGDMWAAGRIISITPYGVIEKMALCEMSMHSLHPKLVFPSRGDCSYPGMVYESPHLYISYYSSHEKNTAIYLAKVLVN